MANQENKNTGMGYKNEGAERKAPGQTQQKDSNLKADSRMQSGSEFSAGRGAKDEEEDTTTGNRPQSRKEAEAGEGFKKKAV